MTFIKKVLFAIIPITTLLIFVSYGIALIFGENLDITYLVQKEITTDTNIVYDSYIIFDWQAYLSNLTNTNIIKPFETLGNSIIGLIDPIKTIIDLFKNTNWIRILLDPTFVGRILINIGILTTDMFIFGINLVVAITQALNEILGALLKLIAVNTEADVTIFNIFRAFDDWELLPTIKGFNW